MAKASEVQGLQAGDELRAAAVKILWTRFEDMWEYRDAVVKEFDADAVHDMRVASRRLRTAMQTFRPCFHRKSYKDHYQRITGLADALGRVRDRDVQLEELRADLEQLPDDQRSGVAGLVETLRAERKEARADLRSLLKDSETAAYDRDFLSYLARVS
jgi:CHAD domain-containing protein